MHYTRFISVIILTTIMLAGCSSKKDTTMTPTDKPIAPIEIQNTNSVNNF